MQKSLLVQLSQFKRGVEVMTSICMPKQVHSITGCDLGMFYKYGRQLKLYKELDFCIDMSHLYLRDNILSLGWKKLYEETLEFLKDYDVVYCYSLFMTKHFKLGDQTRFNKFIEFSARDDKNGMGFRSTLNQNKFFTFMKALRDSDCKVVQICLDPQEASIQKVIGRECERVYSLDGDNTSFLPFYEYEEKKFIDSIECDKELDFMFKGTALSKDRDWLRDFANSIENTDSFILDVVGTGKNPGLKSLSCQSDYFYDLKRAKYSLVIPSYDKRSFSIQRFTDALFAGCIPLVLDTCCLDDFQWTFPEAYDLLQKSGWIVNTDNFIDKISCYNEDMEVASEMLECFHRCLSEDEIEKEWSVLDV